MKEIVRYILETVVCSGILYGAYLLFLRNCTGYLAARLCLTGSLLAAALVTQGWRELLIASAIIEFVAVGLGLLITARRTPTRRVERSDQE